MSFRNRDGGRIRDAGYRVRGKRLRTPGSLLPAPRSSRRGVLLLVVLSLLVLFMLLGTAFLMSSNQYRTAAVASAKHNRVGNPPTKLLDRALVQVLCDTGNPNSVIRYHSLLRDMYGGEGFEAVVYSPIADDLSVQFPANRPESQVTRYATPTNGAPPSATRPLGPTQGQLIDIYIREHAFQRDDRLILGNEPLPAVPDARNVIKLERSVLGLPEMYNMPLTKGYFNGCTLTVTSGPARGQTTRIVDYDYIGEPTPTQTSSTAPASYAPKTNTRIFRFRVLAFPNADGSPLLTRAQLPTTDSRHNTDQPRAVEIADLASAHIIVNGRPFNGTGAGFNELARAGEPRLNAREGVLLGTVSAPTPGSVAASILNPEIALAPNSRFFFASDPLNDATTAANDQWGARYRDPATGNFLPLNPTLTDPASGGVAISPINLRPLLWKYPTFAGPGGADESYDAPDFQNMALALQTVTPRARGRVVIESSDPLNPSIFEANAPEVVDGNGNFDQGDNFLRLDLEDLPIPSYHRPDLVNYWFHRLAQFAADPTAGVAPITDEAVAAVLQPYGVNGIREASGGDDPGIDIEIRDQIVAMKRKFIMRPLREDHPNFDGSNPSSRNDNLPTSLERNGNIAVPFWEAVGPWDVDNDSDGVPDSVWVDLGDPVQQAEDGTLYKPLYAFLIVDLDSRLNVNAHGLVEHFRSPEFSWIPNPDYDPSAPPGPGNLKRIFERNLANDLNIAGLNRSDFLPSGSGYGPAEISLRPLFSPNLPGNADTILDGSGRTYASLIGNPAYDDYARILVGRPAFSDTIGGVQRDQPSVWGRHGSVNVRGDAVAWTNNLAAADETLKVRPGVPYNGAIVPGVADPAFSDRLSIFKFFGYSVWPSDVHGDKMQFPLPTVPTAFSSPPDMQGRYAIGLDYAGQPADEAAADAWFYLNSQSLLLDTPYELNLSNSRRRDAPDSSVAATIVGGPDKIDAINDDAPFATADLERIVRAHDADSGILPDRLWSVVDAFDPLKLRDNQPALVDAAAINTFGSAGDAERLAAAQQIAEVNRRLVTTDSYDVPTPATGFLKRLVYGADGQPGQREADDDTNGAMDDPAELGWYGSDDWYAVMYHTPNTPTAPYFNGSGAPTPPAGIRLAPQNPTIVDLLKYRIQYERVKKDPTLPIYTELKLNQIVQQLLAPELLAGKKMDLNRPFGDGRDNGDGIDNDVSGFIDEPNEPGDPYLNGIVDDPTEAGEPFLDANGNGKWDAGEKFVDMLLDGAGGRTGIYDGPRDQLWREVTNEPITFDYTNGHGESIHPQYTGADPFVPATATVRNLNSQGRQLYARQLYCLMLLLMDENYLEMPDVPSFYGNDLGLELQRIQFRLDRSLAPFAAADADDLLLRRKLTAKRIAQWAINAVDFRDADAIMTPFEYDENPWDGWGCVDGNDVNIPLDGDVATNENLGFVIDWQETDPTDSSKRKVVKLVSAPPVLANQTRGVVWGAERPELLMTETLAFHDRRSTDETLPPNSPSIFDPPSTTTMPDYDLDQRLKPRGSLFVELYNPWSADGPHPAELYGNVSAPGNPPDQGVMLNRLSDAADPVSGQHSPVWRLSVLRNPLNGRMPVFRNPANGFLYSGVMKLQDDPATAGIKEGFNPDSDPPNQPIAGEPETVSSDILTVDPDGYGINMDEAAERHVYFTTGGDTNRSDDDLPAIQEKIAKNTIGEWDYANKIPLVNQLSVRVPPLPLPREEFIDGKVVYVSKAKRYFIARTERGYTPGTDPNDTDVTIAPILPGRYAVVGSSGLQLRGLAGTAASTPDGAFSERYVTPISRDENQPENASGDSELIGGAGGRLPYMRRIELWPSLTGNPNVNQVLVAENGGPEFVRLDSTNVVNVTDPNLDGNPIPPVPNAPRYIDPAVAIPVEDLNISEPVDGYPSATYRKLYATNRPRNTTRTVTPFPEPPVGSRWINGQLVVDKPYTVNKQGDLVYDGNAPAATMWDRPLDTEFELIRNGTTQNYRSLHLQRLANPTLPWNPLPFDSAGVAHPFHRPELPVNPYLTIDSQSVDLTAYNGASILERTSLPGGSPSGGSSPFVDESFLADKTQANILAPITATQFLESPDAEIWAMILLIYLRDGTIIGNSPDDVRKKAESSAGLTDLESQLAGLEDLDVTTRTELTRRIDEAIGGPNPKKFPDGMTEGWYWHMFRRALPDDPVGGSTPNTFRQWLHFKSLERGYHASNYFKYPKPGAFYSSNPSTLEGWAPDVSVLPRTLWKQERPNARLFLQGFAPANNGVVDASDLKNVASRRALNGTNIPPELPDSQIDRNRLVWDLIRRKNPTTPIAKSGDAVFDYVLEQTLGFANETFTPAIERDGPGVNQIISTMLREGSPRPGAPEVAIGPDSAPADPLTYGATPLREIWSAQRQAGKISGTSTPAPQPSLLQQVNTTSPGSQLETDLAKEFYERRRALTKSTFPWLTWNDRPLVSAEEILQVPAASSSLMLRDYSLPTLFTVNPSEPVATGQPPEVSTAKQKALQHAPFGHLLNVFTSSIQPAVPITDPLESTGAANFNRILDFVEVPSRYVGTETLLSPEVFNDNPFDTTVADNIASADDPRYRFQPPFNKVSRERDPGKVNLNTVTGRRAVDTTGFIHHWSEVYDGIMHRHQDNNLLDPAFAIPSPLQLNHFGPAWRDVVLSRRGYAQYNADSALVYNSTDPSPVDKLSGMPDTMAFGLNKDFPSMFSNPFRSADSGDLVPLNQMLRPGVEATLLRSHHYSRADDKVLETAPFAGATQIYSAIGWGLQGIDDDGNGIIDDIHEAGFGTPTDPPTVDADRLRIDDTRLKALGSDGLPILIGQDASGKNIYRDRGSSGIPLFSEQVPVPAIDGERNPGMMYQPMTRLSNLVTTRSNVYAIWVTVGYFEVERAPDWVDGPDEDSNGIPDVRERFGGDNSLTSDKSIRGRALYDRVYPDGYTLGEELGTDTGNTDRHRAFYIIDRTEPVGFKPGEELNVQKAIRVRRRIE